MSNTFEHELRERLLDERPPADLTISAAEVVRLGEQEVRRRRSRVRNIAVGVGTAAALVVAVPLVSSQLDSPSSTSADSVAGEPASAAAGKGSAVPHRADSLAAKDTVTIANGQERLVDLTIRESSPEQLSLRLLPKSSGTAQVSKTVTAPSAGSIAVGDVDGMPFYVVRGRVTEAMVSFGPTLEDRSVRTTQLIERGGFTVLWPDQKGLRQTARQPIGVVWTQEDKMLRARTLPGTYPDLKRAFIDIPGGGQALLSSDSTSVQLETVAGVIREPLTEPITLVSAGELDLPGLAFGVGTPEYVKVSGGQHLLTTTDSGMFALGIAGLQRDATLVRPSDGATEALPPTGVDSTTFDISASNGGVTRTVKVPTGYVYPGRK